MRRALFALLAIVALAGLSGCAHDRVATNGGPVVGRDGHLGHVERIRGGRHAGRADDDPDGYVSGPPVAQVAYPYYTLRGPRDFLDRNPPSIGP